MAQLAAEYIRDMTFPNLLNFTVDMDNGTIQFFFDETRPSTTQSSTGTVMNMAPLT